MHERLRHRSVHNHDGYRWLASTRSSVHATATTYYDHGVLLGKLLYVDGARYTRQRALFHMVEDFPKDMVTMIKHVPEGISRLRDKSRFFDPTTLASCKAVKRFPLVAIPAVSKMRFEHPFPYSQNTSDSSLCEHIQCEVSGCSWIPLSLMSTKRGRFVFRIESITS